jgi:FkbM family methyltransferase
MLKRVAKTILPGRILIHLQALDHWFSGEPELHLVERLCSRSRIAIDVGANIGTYTYFLRRHAARVVAYEPNPSLAELLRRAFPDVRVRNVAASDRAGMVTLRMPVARGRPVHELASISQAFDDATEIVAYQIPAVMLDSEELDDVGFLKIDVEQHERQVLRGAIRTIERWRPNIMTEATPLMYETGLIETFRFLTELGYQGWFTFKNRPYPFSLFDPRVHANPDYWGKAFMNTNIFFFPEEVAARELLGA